MSKVWRCSYCQMIRINGVICHELGCPDAWRTYLRECRECGFMFRPEESGQRFCSDSCYRAWAGLGEDHEQ